MPLEPRDAETPRTRLVVATAQHFDWAIRARGFERSDDGLSMPEGGIETPEVLAWIRATSGRVSEATGHAAAWLIVSDDEVVGIVSFKALPSAKCVEIGYGVAPSRGGRGHATRAVALLIDEARAQGFTLVASTSPDNDASHAVLERNAFLRAGERVDADEGPLWDWRRAR